MTFAQKYSITDDEREALVQRVAERFQDYVYVEAVNWTRETLQRIYDTHGINKTDTLNLTFTTQQVMADVLVELGHHRRNHSWLRRTVVWLRQWFGLVRTPLGTPHDTA